MPYIHTMQEEPVITPSGCLVGGGPDYILVHVMHDMVTITSSSTLNQAVKLQFV